MPFSPMGVSKNRGKTTKMDGENNRKPYFLMDDLGGFNPLFSETPISLPGGNGKIIDSNWCRYIAT